MQKRGRQQLHTCKSASWTLYQVIFRLDVGQVFSLVSLDGNHFSHEIYLPLYAWHKIVTRLLQNQGFSNFSSLCRLLCHYLNLTVLWFFQPPEFYWNIGDFCQIENFCFFYFFIQLLLRNLFSFIFQHRMPQSGHTYKYPSFFCKAGRDGNRNDNIWLLRRGRLLFNSDVVCLLCDDFIYDNFFAQKDIKVRKYQCLHSLLEDALHPMFCERFHMFVPLCRRHSALHHSSTR